MAIRRRSRPGQSKSHHALLVPVALATGVLLAGCSAEAPPPPVAAAPSVVAEETATRPAPAKPQAAERVAIDPCWVAEGADLVLHLRPAALLASDEGRRVWRALGPRGEVARAALEAAAGASLERVERVVVSVVAGASYGELGVTIATKPLSDEPPLLRRELEQLLASSDAGRTATLLVNPGFLRNEGAVIVGPAGAPLRGLFDAVVDRDWKGIVVALDLSGQRLRWELRVAPDVADPAVAVSRSLLADAARWPGESAGAIEGPLSPYAATVVGRLPQMLDVTARHATRSTEREQAILSGVLPAKAAHNVLLGAELAIAELGAPRGKIDAVAATTDQPPRDVAARLAEPVTVEFERESLETALRVLSDKLGVPIEVAGRDLQLEGITRNQMLSLSVQGRSAEEALVEVLRKANPDRLAEGPSDPRQKLVYVVRQSADPAQAKIIVTTRAAAALRKVELPRAFQL
ncbi:MAG: hypothetical protein ACRCT8_14610 [Lacipirellulaceae bacterium]